MKVYKVGSNDRPGLLIDSSTDDPSSGERGVSKDRPMRKSPAPLLDKNHALDPNPEPIYHQAEPTRSTRSYVEQDPDHRTISTRRALRRRPSFVYKPPGQRSAMRRQSSAQNLDSDDCELPSLEERELPAVSQKDLPVDRKKRTRAYGEYEDSDEDRVEGPPPRKRMKDFTKINRKEPSRQVETVSISGSTIMRSLLI